MSGFNSLNLGVLGLRAASTALNTTAHNLANVYTEGYVRQQTIFSDYTYKQVGQYVNGKMLSGLGVYVNSTSHARDILLDKAYREETGRQNFYNAQYTSVDEVETILGELEGTAFQDEIEDLWSAINEVAADPGNSVARSELVMAASTFISRATTIYSDLVAYQETLNKGIENTVDSINELGDKIKKLNEQISAVEATGIESANVLRETRDLMLDELSGLVKISYTELDNGTVTVKAEGIPFVTQAAVFHMAAIEMNGATDGSTYKSAVWPHLNNQLVCDITEKISTARGNDIGKLKGLLLSRGEYIADYTDVPQQENFATVEEYEAACDVYNVEINDCLIMKTQALFDQLINGIVTSINDVLSPLTTTSFTGADGTAYNNVMVLDTDKCSCGNDGEYPAEELFSRIDSTRYTEVIGDDGNTYYVYNVYNAFGTESLYKCSNLQVNPVVLADYTKVPLTTTEGEADMKCGEELMKIWETTFSNIDPNNLTDKNFKDYYSELVYEIGNMGTLYLALSTTESQATAALNDSRHETSSVSSEEELTNMIKFQSAYGAASRYINVIDEMLEHIVTQL